MAEDVESPVSSSNPVPSTTRTGKVNTRNKNSATKTGTPKKRHRRTNAQIALDEAEAERNGTKTKKAKVTRASRSGSKKKSPGTQGIDTTDNNPQFILSDYQHICSYLEDDEKFSDLYGDKKTDVGPKVLTKKAAFEIFAIYVNAHSNKRLSLNGRQLQQRIGYFMSKKFMPTKHFANHTGAGILDDNPHATIDELLESKCPCYARFDTIFGTRANVTPLSQFDSLRPTPLNRLINEDGDLNEDEWGDSHSQQHADIGDINNSMCMDDLVPLLSDKEPDSSTPTFVTCTALVRYDPNRASASAPKSTSSSVPINPSTGTVPVTPTPSAPRRTFANQNNANELAPPKERPDKAKSSLASAYQSVSEKKYEMLETHLVWQKERFQQETQIRQESENRRHKLDQDTLKQKEDIENQRLGWEKERYDHERAERAAVATADKIKQNDRLAAAERWLAQGKSASEVESLLKALVEESKIRESTF
ncbi:hypothetical protein Pst134EA_005534 [Puccinia striiformis f. sp. tritici]|uniref:hypothetical protein n=1 Tax=Puccinia striiformis f. sp. tritici TaxID=168172 RepID=UPI002007271D|nr:hypothetical protein Pst134EA_005534 [Puccinia striiformis f. sp. tritici]KAH9471650.1 hypothetical protein Pst134EA_005534 [Puccinia striiformis f. sp. tritici]